MAAKKPAPRPAEGVEFPKDAEGNRPTMTINKTAFASAMRAVNADEAKQIDDLPDRKWRRAYQKNVVEQVRQSAKSSENALSIAEAGLSYLHKTMEFVRPAGAVDTAVSLEEAMAKYVDKKFQTHEIQGSAPRASKYSVPYKSYGTPGPLKELSGNALHKQIDTWVRNGAIEMSCGNAMSQVIDNEGWCDLSDTYFVLFGATSAMGPFYKLMDLGANVVALDLDRPAIWEKLLAETRKRAGKLIFPVKEPVPEGATDAEIAKIAGCNLLTDTPEIRTWLQDIYPEQRLVCMALAYLDGALFVKVSMAMDAIINSLIEKRGADKMGLAYLCTPTDAHLCTTSSVEAAKANLRKAPMWQNMLAPVLNMAGLPVKKNVERPITDDNGNEIEGLAVVDCIIPEQGPNYILAKRLQHWRAMVSRQKGCIVSSNIAPSTATASVLSNITFALAYKGMSSIRPMDITYQETSNSVMAALLIRDIRDPTSASNPQTPLRNPLSLFTEDAFHGGVWRGAWKFQCVGALSLLSYVFSAFIVNPYLILYSLYQISGWLPILSTALTSGKSGLWATVGPQVTFYQFLGLLEVAHAAVGMTRSSPIMTFVQIFSRCIVLCLLNECPTLVDNDSIFILLMVFAWSLADTTRYVYYAVGQIRDLATAGKSVAGAMKMIKMPSVDKADDPVFKIPFPLVWLRYSLFIPLYPIGIFTGELCCIWMTISGLTGSNPGSQTNTLSAFTFQALKLVFAGMANWQALAIILFGYVLGLPALFGMLWATRKKLLAPAPRADRAKKSQ